MEFSNINRLVSILCSILLITPSIYPSKLDSETILFDDMLLLDEEQLCNEYSKDCHCGSIANSGNISLFTRIVYPNSTYKIVEYDEDIPYGYKYLSVYYRCSDEEDVLVGNNMRKCTEGNWIGQVPRCAINLRNQTKLNKLRISDFKYRRVNVTTGVNSNHSSDRPISATTLYYDETLSLNPNGTFEIPLNYQPAQCLTWSLSPNQIWSLVLDKPTRVHYVRIKLFGNKIEDLYLSREIAFDMVLKNISYLDLGILSANASRDHFQQQKHYQHQQQQHFSSSNNDNRENTDTTIKYQPLAIDIGCRETIPKVSQYVDSAQHKYSANYLVLDFLCEIENTQKSLFEYFFSEDYEIDHLYTNVIDVHFRMLKINLPEDFDKEIVTFNSGSTSPQSILHTTSSTNVQNENNNPSTDKATNKQANSRTLPNIPKTPSISPELEFKQKIIVASLCELKLYSFRVNCGQPDIPVNALVQQEYSFLDDSERKTYKYICLDVKNHELKGNPYAECGPYGRWRNDFPECVRIRPCKLLSQLKNSDAELTVHYEMQALTKSGKQVIPNDKWARFACIKSNNRKKNDFHHYTQIICRNGKWIGLDLSANSACIDLAKLNIVDKKSSFLSNTNASLAGLTTKDGNIVLTTGQLVSLPVILIRILFALFITLCLIIICLLVYMVLFRRRMLKASSIKRNDYYSHDIPTILFDQDTTDHSRIYARPSENDLYESIPDESSQNPHYQRANENYSDIITWTPDQNIVSKGEERKNSIYGFDDDDDDQNDINQISITRLPFQQIHLRSLALLTNIDMLDNNQNNDQVENFTIDVTKEVISEDNGEGAGGDDVRKTPINRFSIENSYNQLSRSSSMFMKANSIYES